MNNDCPYCPYLIDIMKHDDKIDTDMLYFSGILESIPKFILRHKEQIKLFILAFETKDPEILT